MRDCFPWLLNLYSNQCEPSNSKSRFGSAILLKEEHHLKKHITWKSFRTSGKSEASQSPIMMCTLITKKLNPLSYHHLSLPHWDTVTAASHWQRFVVTRQPAVLEVDPVHLRWSLASPFRMWEQQASNIFFLHRNKTMGKENLFASLVFLKHFKIAFVQNPLQNYFWRKVSSSQIEQNLKLPMLFFFPAVRISQARSLLELTWPVPIPAWSPAGKTTKNSDPSFF